MSLRLTDPLVRTKLTSVLYLGPKKPNCLPVLWPQCRQRNISTGAIPQVEATSLDIATFKRNAFDAQKPLVVRASPTSAPNTFVAGSQALAEAYRTGLPTDVELPYELVGSPRGLHLFLEILDKLCRRRHESFGPKDDLLLRTRKLIDQVELIVPGQEVVFLRFMFPFELFKWAHRSLDRYKEENKPEHVQDIPSLYIAQADLDHLSKQIPIPQYVKQAGKGDIYKSSLWMGLEPTYTPWHRDPNPNYFFQLVGSKTVRLLPPNRGQLLFDQAMTKIPPADQSSSRVRGEEMMQHAQRTALTDVVWGEEAPEGILETVLEPGDALFIPQGWWHSLKGGKPTAIGKLNVSFNWWFR